MCRDTMVENHWPKGSSINDVTVFHESKLNHSFLEITRKYFYNKKKSTPEPKILSIIIESTRKTMLGKMLNNKNQHVEKYEYKKAKQ